MNKRFLAAGASVAAAAMVLSACTPPGGGNDDQASENQVLNVGWNQAFTTMNNMTSYGNATANANLLYMMNDNFGYYDDKLEEQPGDLGTMEKVSDDPLKVKYTFNDNATWSDGTPVDAADLALTWAANSSNFNTVDSNNNDDGTVKENDENTVYFDASSIAYQLIEEFPEVSGDSKEATFTFTKPFADWAVGMGFGADGVGLPAHIVAKKALGIDDPAEGKKAIMDAIKNNDKAALSKISNSWNSDFNFASMPDDEDLLVHNGPYKMTDFVEGQYLTMKLDENYKGPKKPKIDTVTIRYNGDPMAMVQAVENGEVDLTQPQPTADVLEAAQGIDGVTVESGDDATYEHVDLTFNNNGPFDPASYGGDEEKAKKVRQAILKTVPRQEIVDKIIKPLNPDAEVRNSFNQVPGSPMYDEIVSGSGIDAYDQVDIEGAKKLLEEVGGEIKPVRIMYDNTNSRRQQEFQLIKESAEKAGFTIEDVGDVNWSARLGDGSYDLALFGWQSTNTGITNSDSNYRTKSQNNYGGYSNPATDKVLDELLVAPEADGAKLSTDLEKNLVDDAFGLPIFQFPGLTIYRDSVSGVSNTTVAPTVFWNYWDWEKSGN